MLHRLKIRATVAWLAVALTLPASPATAALVLDQSYEEAGASHFTGGIAGYQWQQGVTAGMSGLLANVELNFFGTGTTRVFINPGAPWQTDADAFSTAVTVSAPGWTSIDVSSAGIHLTPGDEFSLGFEGFGSTVTFPSVIGSSGSGTYAGGALFFNGSGYTNGSLGSDINFRTYVDVAAVPLPAAAYLLGWGLVGLVPFVRRRATAASPS